MKTKFSFILLTSLFWGLCNSTNAQSWDFTKGFSPETLAGLQKDSENYGCWYPENETRYRSQCGFDTLSYFDSSGKKTPIPETYGLTFTYPEYVFIDHGYEIPHLNLNKKEVTMTIPNLVAGQRITIVTKTGNNTSARGIICTSGNTTHIKGEDSSVNVVTHVFEVNEDIADTAWVTFQPMGGAIHIYSIAITDLTDINVVVELLGTIRKQVTDWITDLNTLGLNGIKNELITEYEKTMAVDETSTEAVNTEIERLRVLVKNANQGKSTYYGLIDLIKECDSLITMTPSEELSTAMAHAQTVVENIAISTTSDMISASSGLKSARNIHVIKGQAISSWQFNTTATVGEYYLALDKINKVARINSYQGTDTNVTIPETITYQGIEYIIVGIGGYSKDIWYNSYSNNKLISVELPKTLKFIGAHGFRGCEALKAIEIPQFVEKINEYAFSNCSKLNSIQLPDSLTTIGSYAFESCHALENLTIPAKVTSLESNPFNNCKLLKTLTCEGTVPPICTSNFPEKIRIIYVPAGSGVAYRNANYWKNRIIVDGEGLSLTINVAIPGTLGEEILKKTKYLNDVNNLTVTGTLNNDDNYNIQNRMTNLLTIDMSGVDMMTLPNQFFYQRYALQKVILPKKMINIGSAAFYQCYNLQDIELPSTIKTIGESAFVDCDNLSNIVIPGGISSVGIGAFANCDILSTVTLSEGLKSISNAAFRDCQKLRGIKCPSTLKTIEAWAFQNCYALNSLMLNEGLTEIGDDAFYDCDSLTEVVLPSTLISCNSPFNSCDRLVKVTSLALFPPYLFYNESPISNQNMERRALYVPEMAINKYKLTKGWDTFPTIEPINGYLPKDINIHENITLTLPDGLTPSYKPNVTLLHDNQYKSWHGNAFRSGSLTLQGNATLSMGNFSMAYDPNYDIDYGNSRTCYTTLINETAMRADSISIDFWIRTNRWAFISFPFDVKVSDIKITETAGITNWVIRKYSGEARANQELDKTWQNMTAEHILHAGEGYIMQCNRTDSTNNNNYNYSRFTVSAINNTNKNLIFANDTRSVTLNEYISEFSHNRSWNLIGNPFPCYYDTRAMDYKAPITVWNMSEYDQNGNYVGYGTYTAYSPIDDDYILRPGEAFFVQRPVDVETIAFPISGRQIDRTVHERTNKVLLRSAVAPRQVYNLNLNGDRGNDRIRFVINENATAGYDMNNDAAKFMSDDTQTAQLFTIEGNVNYAINERPLGNGIITLGAHFANEGTYTLSLNTKSNTEVTLIDKIVGKETVLNSSNYTFTSQAGTITERFLIKLGSDITSVDNTTMQATTTVTSSSGRILVNAPEVTDITVYTVEGKIVSTAHAASASFDVENGFYVVKVHGVTYKLTVTR